MPLAVITGASRGIGRAIALRLASAYEIVALARSDDALESLAQEIEAGGGHCRPGRDFCGDILWPAVGVHSDSG